jgi:hypothetical protein
MISPFAVADPISLSIAMSFYEDNRGLEWCQEKRGEERNGKAYCQKKEFLSDQPEDQ